jgi:carnitine O-acetyltransferase
MTTEGLEKVLLDALKAKLGGGNGKSSLSTFEHDPNLPKLPVPDLDDTLKRLAGFVEALPDQSPGAFEQFQRAIVESKPQLERAQAILQNRFETLPHYLGGWWDDYAYLMTREPNVLVSNVFAVRDSDFDQKSRKPNPPLSDPAARTALIFLESLTFRNLLQFERLPPDTFGARGSPLCMEQYRRYYSVRIPKVGKDELQVNPAAEVKYLQVMYKGRMFVILAKNPRTGADWTFSELKSLVKAGVDHIREKLPALRWDECVGALTAGERDSWAKAWTLLEKASEENKQNLEILTKDILAFVAIDDEVPGSPPTSETAAIEYAALRNPHNRWYDRSVQRIVLPNGVALENGDHTAMDAVVMATVPFELMAFSSTKYLRSEQFKRDASSVVLSAKLIAASVKHLNWTLTNEIREAIATATTLHEKLCSTAQVDIYKYQKYGRDQLRALRVNGDALIQQALQLGFFFDRKKLVPVYESASTRNFQRGRTDTIRSFTKGQQRFVQSVVKKEPVEKQAQCLLQAVKEHVRIAGESASGRGVDRHLLGLKLALLESGSKQLPPIFSDPLVAASANYQLLTSQMVGEMFVGGFAHVLPDGYGCCYYQRRKEIAICVSGNKCGNLTDLVRFQKNLDRAFDSIGVILQSLAQSHAGKPKL